MATITNSDIEQLQRTGYLVVNDAKAVTSDVWQSARLEFMDFLHWIMLERTNIAPDLYRDPEELASVVVGKTFDDAERIFGDPRALSLVPTNDTNRHKKPFGQHVLLPSTSGMGWATSFFDGKKHLELQTQVAEQLLEPIYAALGEQGSALHQQEAESKVADAVREVGCLEHVGGWWRKWLDAKQPVPPDEKIPRKAKKIWQAIKALREALNTRTRRIQGTGVPSLKLSSNDWNKIPFHIPHLSKPSQAAEEVNRICQLVHHAYHSRAGGNRDANNEEIRYWVAQNRELLQSYEMSLGLDGEFQASVSITPNVQPAQVLLWQGPHWTQAGADVVKYTVFVDAVPRSFFSETVWAFLWECHKVCIVDLGAGSYRDSFLTWHYRKARGYDDRSSALDLPVEMHRFFGAPGESNSCCIVPERFRIKRKKEWSMVHIDRHPLPTDLDQAAAALPNKKQKIN